MQKSIIGDNSKKATIAKYLDSEKSYGCRYCDKTFTKPHFAKIHERVHTGENTGEKHYACRYCGKKFSQSGSAKIHERIHTGDKPFACKNCNYKTTNTCKPTMEMKRKVVKMIDCKNPYSCSFCDKIFAASIHAKIHERIHTGEKPFPCKYCNYKSTNSSNLKKHERTHKNPDMNASVDEKSMKIKDNSKCEETRNGFDKKVIANVNIKKIMRVNNDSKKSFSCKYCDKTFAASASATIHERIHT